MDKADEVAPLEAVLDGGNRTLANRRPDPPEQRFEADPMFIGRPQLHLRMRERRRHGLQQRP